MDSSTSLLAYDTKTHPHEGPLDIYNPDILHDPHIRRNTEGPHTIFLLISSDVSERRQVTLSHHDKDKCKTDIRNLLNISGENDWDGEGGDPVTQKTVDIALNVVENLPGDVGLPEVTADPHGRVDFDWCLNNGTMFTVSVGNDGEVAISGLYQGQSRLTGMAWNKEQEIPCLVHCGLNWLSSMKVR